MRFWTWPVSRTLSDRLTKPACLLSTGEHEVVDLLRVRLGDEVAGQELLFGLACLDVLVRLVDGELREVGDRLQHRRLHAALEDRVDGVRAPVEANDDDIRLGRR